MNEIIKAMIGAGASVIVGLFTFLGVVITNKRSKEKMIQEVKQEIQEVKQEMKVAQAVTDTKIEELTREVRTHNNFAQRMPVVENDIKHIEDDIHELQKYHTHK